MTEPSPADWLSLADDDMVVAKEAHKKGIYHLACFHAQQATEKLLNPDALPGFLPEGPPTEVHSRQALADVEKLTDLIKKEVNS